MKFQRNITLIPLIATSIGGMIGSGWLFGALYAAHYAGPAAIVSWVIAGVMMVFIGLTFIEISVNKPTIGGIISFVEGTHDDLVLFTASWLGWLSNVVLPPIETIAVIQYASNYFHFLVEKKLDTTVLTPTGIVIAAIILLLLTLLNRFGGYFFAKSNSYVVAFKFIVPLVTVLTLIIADFHANNFIDYGGFMPFGWHGVFTALPMAGVMFSLIGFSSALQMAEEIKNIKRDIPLAVFGSLLICVVLYILLQLAFIGALLPSHLAAGWTQVNFVGVNGPFAGLASLLGIFWLVALIYVDAVFSPIGTAYVFTATSSRMSYALAKLGFFPSIMTKLNKHGSPTIALIINYFVGLALLLPLPGWQKLVPIFVLCVVIVYAMGPIGAIIRRMQTPEDNYRIRGMHIIAPLAFYACSLIIYWTGWNTISIVLITIAIGYALFFAIRNRGSRPFEFIPRHSAWLIVYLLGMGIIAYFSSFGGGTGLIPFGWDFLIVGIFSIVIFYWAIFSRRTKSLR